MNTSTVIQLAKSPVAPAHLTPDLLDRLAEKHGITPLEDYQNLYGVFCISGEGRRYDLSHIVMALAWEAVGGAEIAGNDGEA